MSTSPNARNFALIKKNTELNAPVYKRAEEILDENYKEIKSRGGHAGTDLHAMNLDAAIGLALLEDTTGKIPSEVISSNHDEDWYQLATLYYQFRVNEGYVNSVWDIVGNGHVLRVNVLVKDNAPVEDLSDHKPK